MPDLARHGDADRVREDDLVRSGGERALGDLQHPARVDGALERAAERDADRDAHRPVRLDRGERRQRLLGPGVLVLAAEALGRGEVEVELVELGGGEALGALRVEHEARVDDALAALDRGDDLLRAGHLRDEPGMDEADRLDRGKPGGGEPVDELRAHGGLEHRLLVLEAVARPDVADCDLHGGLGYARP